MGVDPTTETSNIRYWPYAAMDYYIQLEDSPDVSALTETVILAGEAIVRRRVRRLDRTCSRFSATETNSFELWGFSIDGEPVPRIFMCHPDNWVHDDVHGCD